MVIKRKRNSNPTAPVPAPEVKSEETTAHSPTHSSKVERRGRPRKLSETEEPPNEKPSKSSRTGESLKIISFNPKGIGTSNKGKEKDVESVHSEPTSDEQQAESFITTGQEALTSSPISQQSTQQTLLQDTSTLSGNDTEKSKSTRPRRWTRRKVVIKTTGAEIAIPVWYSKLQDPVYIPRYFTKPSPIYYPQTELFLSSVPHQLHFTYFNQLSSYVLYFQKNDIWVEMNILERLYYKNKNQHKRAEYFRKIEEVRRIILRFKEMRIGELMSEFIGLFYGNDKNQIHQRKWEYVPSREISLYVLNRANCATILMDKALKCYLDAYTNFRSLLCQAEFMPFALACLSVLARLNMLTRVWVSEMKKCCVMLKG
ncbi:14969_t:CDS:2, partial [Cetraspora pellucida]